MNLRAILWCFLFLFFNQGMAAGASYPSIKQLKGQVLSLKESIAVENKTMVKKEVSQILNKNSKLRDWALLQVGDHSEILLQLNAGSQLVIYGGSLVELVSIHWKQGVIGEIRLREGKLRYLCEKDCDLKISTALSETVIPVGDYILSMDQKIPSVEMTVIAGETVFRGLENENAVTLRAGDRARFVGVFSEDQVIAYDLLLKGKKVAQGKMQPLEKMTDSELMSLRKDFEEAKLKQKYLSQKKSTGRTALQICSSPNAEFNQCAWLCEKNSKSAKNCDYQKGAQCLRMRCNANGEWSDKTVLPESQAKCRAKTFVSTCDY